MIRRLVKALGAQGLHATGADRLIGALSGRSRLPLVVCYHRVVEDPARHPWSAPAMLVSVRTLEAQLDWIGRRYRFATLDEVARSWEEALRTGGAPERPLAAVTFDDGYEDAYRNAFPLLLRKGIPGAFFVVAGAVGTDRVLPHDELFVLLREAEARLGPAGLAALLDRLGAAADGGLVEAKERLLVTRPRAAVRRLIRGLRREVDLPAEELDRFREDHRLVGWPELREMHAAGMTVGSHTASHRALAVEPEAAVRTELESSKRTLEEGLGAEVAHLSYPHGEFSPAVVEATAAAGYRFAYTTCGHTSPDRPLLTLPRRTFWERSSAGLTGAFSGAVASCQVQGVLDLVRPCRADHRDRPPVAATPGGPAALRPAARGVA